MRPFALLFLAACTRDEVGGGALVGHPDPTNPVVSEGESAPVATVERVSGDGPFLVGSTEEFSATLTAGLKATWSASAGELVQDGDHVWWTLPWEPGEQELVLTVQTAAGPWSQRVRVQTIALSPSAAGPVDPNNPDETGGSCKLVIDASDVPHILYADFNHSQWRYARFNGAAWVTELVDGPGFLTAALSSFHAPGLVVDASGNVHVAINRGDGTVVYGKRTTGGVWTLETVASNVDAGEPVALFLDAGTPVIVDTVNSTGSGAGVSRVRVSRKSGTWSSVIQPTLTGSGIGGDYQLRGATLTGAGAVRLVFYDSSSRSLWTSTWTLAGGISTSFTNLQPYRYDERLGYQVPVISGPTYQGVFASQDLLWSTNGGTTWTASDVYNDEVIARDVAFDGTSPRLGSNFQSNLEFVRPDARGYWSFTLANTDVESYMNMSVALDAANNLHACFEKSGQVWFQ